MLRTVYDPLRVFVPNAIHFAVFNFNYNQIIILVYLRGFFLIWKDSRGVLKDGDCFTLGVGTISLI